MANLLNQALSKTGFISPTTRIIFLQGMTYAQFLSQNGIEDRIGNLMSYSMLRAANHTFPNPPAAGLTDSVVTLTPSAIEAVTEQGSVWVVDLVACHQVSSLNESNVTNYFTSKGSDTIPWKVLDVVGYLASVLPKFAELDGFDAILRRSTFVGYHTSASSSASLVMRANDAAPFSGVFTEDELSAAQDSLDEFHSIGTAQLIPSRALVMTSIILQCLDVLPANWYMGKKAVAAYSPVKYAKLMALMKKAIKLSTSIEEIEEASDILTLQNMWLQANP